MKRVNSLLIIASLFAAKAAAHTSALPHSHPHTEQTGVLNSILAIGGLSILAAIAWYASQQASKRATASAR